MPISAKAAKKPVPRKKAAPKRKATPRKKASPAKKEEKVPGLETGEDRSGFGITIAPDWHFSQIIAQLHSGTSVKGVEVGLELLSECIRSGDHDYLEELLLMQAVLLNNLFTTNTVKMQKAETLAQVRTRSPRGGNCYPNGTPILPRAARRSFDFSEALVFRDCAASRELVVC